MPHPDNHSENRCIYLVDDEPDIRRILTALLEHLEPKWHVAEFENAETALAACETKPPHLIISDQTMPRVTGTEFFDIVRQKYPETIRILISGHATTANKIASAHQYLAKPFDIQEVAATMHRAFNAQKSLNDPALARLLGSLNSFPALPRNCLNLLQELESDANTENMNRLISEDGGVLTRALQIANSPLFRGGTVARDARSALMLLGTRTMRALVLSVHVFEGYEKIHLPELDYTRLWHHCCQTAGTAQQLAREQLPAEEIGDVFFAGLVHDLGRLILMENRAAEYAAVCRRALDQNVPLEEAEAETFGKDHTRITRFLLELWGMPDAVCRAVSNHLQPWLHPEETELNLTTILYVANHLARAQNPPDRFVTPPLNLEHLEAVGFCTARLPLSPQPTAHVEATLQPR